MIMMFEDDEYDVLFFKAEQGSREVFLTITGSGLLSQSSPELNR